MNNNKLNFIDLFAGAGGLSEGFIRSGFNPIAHVEIDEAAAFTLKTRTAYYFLKENGESRIYESYLKGEINRAELYEYVPQELIRSTINLPIGAEFNQTIHNRISEQVGSNDVDLIVGGPPCQAYSLVGRARSANNMEGDPRNFLYVEYAGYLEKYKPKMFVFENVLGLRSAGGGMYLDNMRKLFTKKGYSFTEFIVNASNFGVLQNRRRIIIVGWINDFIPNISDLGKIDVKNKVLVETLFDDLAPLNDGEGKMNAENYFKDSNDFLSETGIRNGSSFVTQHLARPQNELDKKIYKIAAGKWKNYQERLDYNDLPEALKTHKNRDSFIDRFKVVAPDLTYSQTVVAHIAKDGHYYIHPDINQNRSISVREAARLQSFPDNFYFEGIKEGANRTAAFKQIGNAVPVLMASIIAETLKGCF